MKKWPVKARFNITYLLLAVFAVVILQELWNQSSRFAPIPYSEYLSLLHEGKVAEVVVGETHLRGTLKEPFKDGDLARRGRNQFITTRMEPVLAEELAKNGVRFSQVVEGTFVRDLLSWIVPVLFFFGIWFFLARRMAERSGLGGGFMSVGKSKAKIYVEDDTKTSFKDVAGVEEAKQELEEVVSFLKDPKSYGRLGGRMPKGVLLVGPPGTGKTLLAKAVAGEAGVPFFSISGSEFVEMFVGVGAARVRDLFEQARGKAPCIIFIDELDALGRARSASPVSMGNDEKEQTLNQLLVEMDGFDSGVGIVLLAATNRPEILDPALLRAGRFDRQILVDKPDRSGRTQILKVHSAKIKLAPGVDLDQIAALTPGFTGADLATLVNEAALQATRRQAENVTLDDFTSAIERIVAGLEKRNRLLNPRERRIVAYHEIGHALVACSLPGSDAVHKVSIIPRGIGSLGYTIQRPTEDRYLVTREELENKMTVLLGGRAAEKLIFDHLSTGASDDLSRVTDIARSMVMRYGMVKALGPVTYDSEPVGFLGTPSWQTRRYSEQTAHDIDRAVREIVESAFDRAAQILEMNLPTLEASASELLEKETLTDKDLHRLFTDIKSLPPAKA